MEKDNGENIEIERMEVCPSLGSCDDPETALAYPSEVNCCYHNRPVVAVRLGHQSHFCLTSDYQNCPIFQTSEAVPPSSELPSRESIPFYHKQKVRPVGLLALGLILIFSSLILWLIFSQMQLEWNFVVPILTPTGTLYSYSDLTPTLNNSNALVVETSLPSTLTSTPSPFPTPTYDLSTLTARTGHSLETLLGSDVKVVIHQVLQGEDLIQLASRYRTSVDAIKAVNPNVYDPLPINSLIIIPINRTDANGLPVLDPYNVDKKISVDDLAKKLSIDLTDFEQLNDLKNGQMLEKGDWVVVPHLGTATP
jgi:hypothetical protein